jgi:hypothetical protein
MSDPIPEVIFPIICDDIRQEVGGKFSVMGIYSDNIVLNKFPFTFSKLCFQIHMKACPRSFLLDIYLDTPDERILLMKDFNFNAKDDLPDKRRNLVLNISRPAVTFAAPGKCRLTMLFNHNADRPVHFPFEVSLRPDIQ